MLIRAYDNVAFDIHLILVQELLSQFEVWYNVSFMAYKKLMFAVKKKATFLTEMKIKHK